MGSRLGGPQPGEAGDSPAHCISVLPAPAPAHRPLSLLSRARPQPPALAAPSSSVCPGLLPLVAATQAGTHVLTSIPNGWEQETGQEFLNTTSTGTTRISFDRGLAGAQGCLRII